MRKAKPTIPMTKLGLQHSRFLPAQSPVEPPQVVKHAKTMAPHVSTAEQDTSGLVPRPAHCALENQERPLILPTKAVLSVKLYPPVRLLVLHFQDVKPARVTDRLVSTAELDSLGMVPQVRHANCVVLPKEKELILLTSWLLSPLMRLRHAQYLARTDVMYAQQLIPSASTAEQDTSGLDQRAAHCVLVRKAKPTTPMTKLGLQHSRFLPARLLVLHCQDARPARVMDRLVSTVEEVTLGKVRVARSANYVVVLREKESILLTS